MSHPANATRTAQTNQNNTKKWEKVAGFVTIYYTFVELNKITKVTYIENLFSVQAGETT